MNVGGTGLRRYARILQREDATRGLLPLPAACLADMDVMPDCAPAILGLVENDADPKWTSSRRQWRAKRDFGANLADQQTALEAKRAKLCGGDGQNVRTFVADEWTLEYDLAYAGLAEEVYVAAKLAANDDPLNEAKKLYEDVLTEAGVEFAGLTTLAAGDQARLCAHVYEMFSSKRASKAIAAQYLAELLDSRTTRGKIDRAWLAARTPAYVMAAIQYATTPLPQPRPAAGTIA